VTSFLAFVSWVSWTRTPWARSWSFHSAFISRSEHYSCWPDLFRFSGSGQLWKRTERGQTNWSAWCCELVSSLDCSFCPPWDYWAACSTSTTTLTSGWSNGTGISASPSQFRARQPGRRDLQKPAPSFRSLWSSTFAPCWWGSLPAFGCIPARRWSAGGTSWRGCRARSPGPGRRRTSSMRRVRRAGPSPRPLLPIRRRLTKVT